VAPLLFFVGVLFFSEYRAINVPDHACCFLAVMLFPFLIWLDVMNRTTATICLLFVLFCNIYELYPTVKYEPLSSDLVAPHHHTFA
jgi:hypothetical protein